MAEDSESSRRGLLPAREELVDLLVRGALAEAPALSVVAAEAGAGRSALLDAVGRDLAGRRVGVLRLRVGEQDGALPYSALYRLLVELGQDGQRAVTERNTVLGLVAKLGADAAAGDVPDEETSARLATSVFAALRRYAPVVLLVDDAHRLDAATAGLVEHLVRRCAGGGCSIVATWCGRAPDDAAAGYGAALRGLFDAGVARAFALRPLTRGQTAAVIAHETAAVPDGELVERFSRLTRGNLSALRTAIERARASGSLRVIDQHAYLGQGLGPPALPAGHPMLARLHDLPPLRRKVVAAMAVLCPVGATATSFVADVLDVAEDAVVAEVGALVADRVLVGDRGGGWRFRHPLVREGLHSWSGPYERRWLCARGVTALWEGRARTDDDDLLPDLLVGAGGLVDRERSAKELQSHGGRLMFTDSARAVHWLRAAVQRTSDERERANAAVLHAGACALGDRMAEAVESSRDLLERHSDELSPGTLQQMQIVHVTALAAREQWDELERIADRTRSPWLAPQSGHEVVTRAFALVLLGRWADGELLLQQWQHVWSTANATTADLGHMVLSSAGVLLGDPPTVRALTAQPKSWHVDESPQFAFEYARHEADMLLLLGELRPALERLRAYSTGVEQLHGSDRFLVQWLGGEHSAALETARRSMAEGESSARMLSPVMMSFDAARLLASRGWISRAQRMAEAGRGPQLGHVLDHVQSAILRFLGSHEEADELLRGGLHRAEEREHVLGTEHMWGDLARRERDLGSWDRARECVHRTEELAWRLGTGRAELVHLVARAEVLDDPAAGRKAVEVARERGTPYECATTFQRVALSGVDTKRLLLEAYELFGELDALLWRAQLRTTLRAHDITVPGRSTATRENERLLAVLVSEGLSNRQVATVFGTSEKSVEGRLTRMFAKSGYRSRVELTAALLRGEYPG